MLNSKSLRKETERAMKSFVSSIRSGYSCEEAMLQVRGSYGMMVWAQLKWDLQDYYKRNG